VKGVAVARVAALNLRPPPATLATCGGIHGDVPMGNLLVYFETRDRMGIPAEV